MDIEDPHWEEYETRFMALADRVELHKGPDTDLASADLLLFLYGDNGLQPEEEFRVLEKLEQQPDQLKGLSMTTSYWEDLVLYLPG